MTALRIALCSLVLLVATAPLMAQGTYTQFDVPGATGTYVNGVNSAGDIVGFYEDTSTNVHGFLLSNGVFTTLIYPGANCCTQAAGINDLGQIVGSYFDLSGNTSVGYVYDVPTSTFTSTFSDPLFGYTFASGINNAGRLSEIFNCTEPPSVMRDFSSQVRRSRKFRLRGQVRRR